MTLAVELEPEHRSEFERIAAEKRANPTPSPRRDERRSDFGVSMKTLQALKANPMAADDRPTASPKLARTSAGVEARMAAFREAVAMSRAPGDRVSVAVAAGIAGVSEVAAGDYIARLKRRGEWPYEAGRSGPRKPEAKSGRRVGSLNLDRLDMADAAKPVEPSAPEPTAVPAVAPPAIASGGLATLAARLREAADLIDRAAAIVADAMGGVA